MTTHVELAVKKARNSFVLTTDQLMKMMNDKNSSTPNTFIRQYEDDEIHKELEVSPERQAEPLNLNQSCVPQDSRSPPSGQHKPADNLCTRSGNNNNCNGRPQEFIQIDLSDEEEDLISVPGNTETTRSAIPFRIRQRTDSFQNGTQTQASQAVHTPSQISLVPINKYTCLKREFKIQGELLEISHKVIRRLERQLTLMDVGVTSRKRKPGQSTSSRFKSLSDQISDSITQSLAITPNPRSQRTATVAEVSSTPMSTSSKRSKCSGEWCLCFCAESSTAREPSLPNVLPISESSWKGLQRNHRNDFREMALARMVSKGGKENISTNIVARSTDSQNMDHQTATISDFTSSSSEEDSGISSCSEPSSSSSSSGQSSNVAYKTNVSAPAKRSTPLGGNISKYEKIANLKKNEDLKAMGEIIYGHMSFEQLSQSNESQSLISNSISSQRLPLSQRPTIPVFNQNNNSWDTSQNSQSHSQPLNRIRWNWKL